MSDLRTRLADALRMNGDTCTRANAEYLADVLLSLPGIAIVELPERLPGFVEGEKPKWAIWNTVIEADRAGVHVNGLLMYANEARAYAARLLVAANAADMAGARS